MMIYLSHKIDFIPVIFRYSINVQWTKKGSEIIVQLMNQL